MPTMMKTLGLDRLSLAERILLVEELWDSLAGSPNAAPLTEAHKQDLQRRLDTYRDNPKAGSPWEEVRERLRAGGTPGTDVIDGSTPPTPVPGVPPRSSAVK